MNFQKYILLFFTLYISNSACAKDITVCRTCEINSVSKAVSIAQPNDHIFVKKGVYKEANIIIDKPIVLSGIDYPELDGESKGEIISIKSNGVTIEGFIIRNTGYSDLHDYAGVKVYNAKQCTIANNRLFNTCYGIALSNSSFCTIKNNSVQGSAVFETSSGNGIQLWKSSSCLIIGNSIDQHRDGIYFEFVKDSRIINNTSKSNIRYGLHFMFSDGNSYEKNTFSKNGAGVAVMYSKNVKMTKNIFADNWGSNAYGLLLKDISNSSIHGNTFSSNTVGIYMEGSAKVLMEKNNFDNNGWALKIMANCTEDTIRNNNFSGNSFDVSTNGSQNYNFFTRNYWDNYKGYDLNHDNIGDIPFRPVSLFSMIVEEVPFAIMLLRSFTVDLLNQAEKTLPTFVPELLVDTKPLMKKYED